MIPGTLVLKDNMQLALLLNVKVVSEQAHGGVLYPMLILDTLRTYRNTPNFYKTKTVFVRILDKSVL